MAQEEELKPVRPAFSENPTLSPQYWARAGVGATLSRYAQAVPAFVDIAASDDLWPSFHVDGGAWFSWHWGVNTYFKSTPGHFKSSATTEIQNGEYNFQRMGIEMLYRTHPLYEKQRKETFLKLGLNQHQLPFLKPVNPTRLTQESSRIRTIGFGVEHHRKLAEKWRLEAMLRYQHPYSTDIKPHMTMDGSLGLIRRFPQNWSLSVFWTGEWHDYKYETGYQNLFQSNFDLRAGVEF